MELSGHSGFYAVVFVREGHGTSVNLHDTPEEAQEDWVSAVFEQFNDEEQPEDFDTAYDRAEYLYSNIVRNGWYCEIADGVGLPNSIINAVKKEAA